MGGGVKTLPILVATQANKQTKKQTNNIVFGTLGSTPSDVVLNIGWEELGGAAPPAPCLFVCLGRDQNRKGFDPPPPRSARTP